MSFTETPTTAKGRGRARAPSTPATPSAAPRAQPRVPTAPGDNTPAAASAGNSPALPDWNAAVSTSTLEGEQINLVGADGDSLGIHALFPKNSIKAGTIEAYKAAIPKMTRANQQQLADILVNAGILAAHTNGKPYTTNEVQTAFSDTLTQVSQSAPAAAPGKVGGNKPGSVTDYLNAAIQQTNGAQGGTSSTSSAASTTAQNQQALQNSLNDSFSKIATAYGIPVSDAAIAAHASAAVASGLDSTQADANFTEYAKQVSSGLYPTFAPQIAGGVDVATLLDPYKNLIEKTVGIDPATIDFTNPKYSQFLNGAVDPATGRAAPMTLSQVSQKLMQDPQYGYQNTQEGKNAASSLVASLLKTFGAIGQDNLSTSLAGPTPDLASAQ